MKKTIIIIILAVLLILLGVYGYNALFNKKSDLYDKDVPGTNFYGEFPNFNNNGNDPTEEEPPQNGDDPYEEPVDTISGETLSFVKVSSMPVAGYGVFLKERFKEVPTINPEEINAETTTITGGYFAPQTEKVSAVRYVAKIDGNIYQTYTDMINEKKFSQTIIPGVHEAFFNNTADGVILRYLKSDGQTISTYTGSLPKEQLGGDSLGTYDLKGSFLPENILDLSVSPDGTKIFYLLDTNNSVAGITANFNGDRKTQIFDSRFTEWLSGWASKDLIVINTKAGNTEPGFLYTINALNRDFSKVLGGVRGLTSLSDPNNKFVLYADNNLTLYLYDKELRQTTQLNVRTLPEKCTWSDDSRSIFCAVPRFVNTSNMPDSWYQGLTSFDDELWRINTDTKNALKILDPATIANAEIIDGTRLDVDSGNNNLLLINKKDSYLWLLRLR